MSDDDDDEEYLRYCPNCGKQWQSPADVLEYELVDTGNTIGGRAEVRPVMRCSHGNTPAGEGYGEA